MSKKEHIKSTEEENPILKLPPKQRALYLLNEHKEQYNLTNQDVAKALNYNESYARLVGPKIKKLEVFDNSSVLSASKTLKKFSKGHRVGKVVPNSGDTLNAAKYIVDSGTIHEEKTPTVQVNVNTFNPSDFVDSLKKPEKDITIDVPNDQNTENSNI